MRFDSKHWNTSLGVCSFHGLPSVPCPACLSQKQVDLEAVLDPIEAEEISWGFATFEELLPIDFVGFKFSDIRVG